MSRIQRRKTGLKAKRKKFISDSAAKTFTSEGSGTKGTKSEHSEMAASSRLLTGIRKRNGKPKKYVHREGVAGYLSTAAQFLREVKIELKKVTWPTRKQAMGTTLVVLILVTIVSFFLGAVDMCLQQLVRVVLQ